MEEIKQRRFDRLVDAYRYGCLGRIAMGAASGIFFGIGTDWEIKDKPALAATVGVVFAGIGYSQKGERQKKATHKEAKRLRETQEDEIQIEP